MYCDYCGAENPDDAATCFACHRALDAPAPRTGNNPVFPNSFSQPLTSPLNSLLKGRYRIVARIGQGGFGSVYKAQDIRNNDQLVAVKEIDMGGLKPQEIIEATDAFNREVQLLSELKHPNLPRMHTHFMDAQHWYLVMDFIEGDTLERYLEVATSGGRPAQGIRLPDVLNIGMQLCTVLHYMHMHNPAIIFRDLKPSNVMLAPGQRVYLIDFGIARIFKPGQVKDTMAFGSPGYAAPEQYGKAQTTPRADIYSLGAILHQMLTGKDPSDTPFHFAPIRFTHPTLPVEIDQLVMQMLEMDPNRRPASMAMVKQRLSAIADQKNGSRGYAGGYMGNAGSAGTYAGSSGNRPLFTTPAVGTGYQSSAAGQNSAGGQGMYPPQAAPPQQAKPNISRRVAVGILGGIVVTTMICSNVGRKSHYQDVQDSASGQQPTRDTLTLTGPVLYALHTAAITALAWAPDGTAVVSASADKTVQVWNPNYPDQRFFALKPQYKQAATTVAWSQDGKSIASGSLDKTVQI
jgi:eukaryotic-like serine/threonine-protein kinase